MTFDPSGQLLELYIDDRLDQAETLNLTIPADAAKADLLVVDGELEVDGRAFYIAELEQRRQGAATVITVEAEALWYRLGDLIWPGAFTITDVTPSAGLATILAGTGWTVADYSTSEATTYTLEAEDVTRLELLRTWADITGKHLRFDTIAREVRLADVAGADLGLAFRYRRNVLNIRRRIRPPACTVLYPYGLDDLSIAGLNGTAYVEDFSYYTAQGLDLATARERFTRSRIWSDTAYTTDTALLAAANTRLAELAAPIITYELDVVDLTELTDADDTVHVGDTCRVADPAFDLDVRTTVVRVQRFPTQPWRNRVELAVLAAQLASRTSAAGRSSSSEPWAQFVGRVTADYQVRTDGTYLLAPVPLRFRAAGGAGRHLGLRRPRQRGDAHHRSRRSQHQVFRIGDRSHPAHRRIPADGAHLVL